MPPHRVRWREPSSNRRILLTAGRQAGGRCRCSMTCVLSGRGQTRLDLASQPSFRPRCAGRGRAPLCGCNARGKGLTLSCSVGGRSGQWSAWTLARLRQMPVQLGWGNAPKSSPDEGRVVIEPTREVPTSPAHRLEFSHRYGNWHDTRAGRRVFEDFSQADATIARRHGRVRPGLAIVRVLPTT